MHIARAGSIGATRRVCVQMWPLERPVADGRGYWAGGWPNTGHTTIVTIQRRWTSYRFTEFNRLRSKSAIAVHAVREGRSDGTTAVSFSPVNTSSENLAQSMIERTAPVQYRRALYDKCLTQRKNPF